jgi:predicted ribosomally synthesized peptide with nif11-like leader
MSVDRARQLIVKAGNDAAFREKIERAAPAERTALLESYGFGGITSADLQAVKTGEAGELSDTDLQAVAGGDVGAWVDWARDWYNYITS